MVKSLREFFTRQLRAVAMPPNILESVRDKSILVSIAFMCAHDTLSDSGVLVTSHLVADCTELSMQIAEIISKHEMQGDEERPYLLIALNAEKKAQKAEKIFESDSNCKAPGGLAVRPELRCFVSVSFSIRFRFVFVSFSDHFVFLRFVFALILVSFWFRNGFIFVSFLVRQYSFCHCQGQ